MNRPLKRFFSFSSLNCLFYRIQLKWRYRESYSAQQSEFAEVTLSNDFLINSARQPYPKITNCMRSQGKICKK